MANWRARLDLTDLWPKLEDDLIGVGAASAEIVKRLEALPGVSNTKTDVILGFQTLAFDPIEDHHTTEDFDEAMEALYDWADNNRVWVATI